jgi:hypothetical protein
MTVSQQRQAASRRLARAAELTAAIAGQCKPGEAAVVFIAEAGGLSCCVASEATARETAQNIAASPVLDDGDVLLAVAVITPDQTLTSYPITA